MASQATEEVALESDKNESEFVKVERKSRKRKLTQETANNMETTEQPHSEVKRPNFPPISADKMAVCFMKSLIKNRKKWG